MEVAVAVLLGWAVFSVIWICVLQDVIYRLKKSRLHYKRLWEQESHWKNGSASCLNKESHD